MTKTLNYYNQCAQAYNETTLNIANNLIKNSTCTCEDYYKGNLCKHIIATSRK